MPVKLQCFLIAGSDFPRRIVGRTENISRSGALVRLPEGARSTSRFFPGDHVKLHIALPLPANGIRPRAIHCTATVAWTSVAPGGDGRLALAVQHMRFCDLPSELDPLPVARKEVLTVL